MRFLQQTGLSVRVAVIFTLLGIGIAAFGVIYYHEQSSAIQRRTNEELIAVAAFKVGQIEAWRQAKIAEGDAIRSNPFLEPALEKAIGNEGAATVTVREWMNSYKKRHDYASVQLLSARNAAVQSDDVRLALETQSVILSDVRRGPGVESFIDLCVPVGHAGVLLVQFDPAVSLYPILENWPLPSANLRFFLLRNMGGAAEYLNGSNDKPNPRTILKATPPGSGFPGKGVDERGVPFVATSRSIPGSPWILAATIDGEDIYEHLRQTALTTALLGTFLFIAAASGIVFLSREQQVRYYRRQEAAQEEQRSLTERLDALSRSSHDIILVAAATNGKIVEANERAIESYGRSRETLLELSIGDLMPPGMRHQFAEQWSRIMEEGDCVFEAEHQRADRSIFPVDINARLIAFDGDMCCQCVVRDVSERKAAQERSRILETAILQISDGVAIVDVSDSYPCQPRPAFINPAIERLTGYGIDDLRKGAGVLLHVCSDARDERAFQLIQQPCAAFGHCPEPFEQTVLRKDGSSFEAEWNFAPLRNEAGIITHCVWVCRDITERKRAEESLRFLSAIVHSSDDAIIGKDMTGRVLSWNAGAERIYGYTAEEMIGKSISTLIPPGRIDEFPAIMRSLSEGRSVEHFETERLTKDGRRIFVSITISPIRNREHKVVAASVIGRDISERKRSEAEIRKLNQDLEQRVIDRTIQLQDANKELEAFAYSVSHDLRAPLRAVDGFSRILLEEYAPQLPDEAQHYIEIARKNAVFMGELIDGLLRFSRLSRQPLSLQPIAIENLVRQVWEDLRSEYESRDVEISIGDLAPCEGDSLLLRQVFANLLSNALKYTRRQDHALIQISSTHPRDTTPPVYSIRDNGVGFDARYKDKLFGVFQRLHRAEDYEGTGVGLATVQRIVQRHGGRIWADSVLNHGATFSFTLASEKRNGHHAG